MYKTRSRFMKSMAMRGVDSRAQEDLRDSRLDQSLNLRAVAGTQQSLRGEVVRIERFGVFVRGGWGQGLVHISQMSRGFVREPSELVELGETIRVWVVNVDARG